MTEQNTTLGIWLMVATTFVFAMQDGISRHLAEQYNVLMVVMIRYWFFAAFVIAWPHRHRRHPPRRGHAPAGLQILRGVLLAAEVCVMVVGFVLLGWSKATPSLPSIRCWWRRCPARCWAKRWAGGAGRPSPSALSAC
jgi:drug/metabolite transporter (DMT)-like permease